MNIIETKNLTKYYGNSLGIKDLNINIEEGEIFGFIGPNGAGKSTTIRLLLNIIYPTSGEAKLFGKDAIKYGPEVRKDISLFFKKVKSVLSLSMGVSIGLYVLNAVRNVLGNDYIGYMSPYYYF